MAGRSYENLVGSATFNSEFFRGTIQDQGPRQLAMTMIGAPTWATTSGVPYLSKTLVNQGSTSAVTPRIIDVTGTFTLECVFRGRIPSGADDILLVQLDGFAGNGFLWYWNSTGTMRINCQVYGGGWAHEWCSAAGTVLANRNVHFVHRSNNAGATCQGWINGVPVTMVKAGAGVPLNIAANRAVEVLTSALLASGALSDLALIRSYDVGLDDEDVSVLYQEAHRLTRGEV